MAYIEHKPIRNKSNSTDALNSIRISFNKNKLISIYVGKSIALQMGLKDGDKVKFFHDDKNKRDWFIKKSSDQEGYTISEINKGKKNSTYLKLQFTLNIKDFVLTESDLKIRKVEHQFKVQEGGISILAN